MEVISSLTNAILLVSRLKKIGENIRDAEFRNVLADLNLELAEAKMKMASLISENAELQNKIRELENIEGDPCPKCRQRTWHVEKSEPDKILGVAGGIRRTSKCDSCGLSESELIVPR